MDLVVADRRLLKAFYTQYTAVLLIILTFTIGAFRRTVTAAEIGSGVLTWAPREVIGSFVTEDLFAYDGSLRNDHPSLEALATVLNSHDLIARVTYLSAGGSVNSDGSSLKRTQRRLNVLRTFFSDHGVVPKALILQARTVSGGAERVVVELLGET